MKTKTKLLFTIGLVAALCIGFLVGISVNFPKVDNSDLAGTFGKAEKFHKVQMTTKDIQLRSEIIKDTAQLRGMIQGLVYFSIFTGDVCADIDLTVIAFKAKGMGSQAGEGEIVKALQDYSDFIRNNNKTLNSTIALLSGFYLNDTANLSMDVEKNLKDFGTYVNGLNQKNMVLSQALKSIDNFILTSKTLQANTTEISQLKSIRDQLLIKGLQLGTLIGNKQQVVGMIEYAVSASGVSAISGKVGFDATVKAAEIQGSFSAKDLTGIGMTYDPSLHLFALGAIGNKGLGNGLQVIASMGTETIKVLCTGYSMSEVCGSQAGTLSADAVYGVFGGGNFGNSFASTGNFGSISSMGSDLGKGPMFFSNEK